MKIYNYYLEHNERLPAYVQWYLDDRYEALENHLFEKYEGTNVDVYVNASRQSESVYIDIEPLDMDCRGTYIRVANHDTFNTNSRSDIYFTMTDYEYWKDLKKDLLNKIDEIVNEVE